jgi:ABC-type multidrug transport system ATPase subunit
MLGNRLILVTGEEGAGKSTIIRALLLRTPDGAGIDAEDVGRTNPWPMDDEFFDLLRRNVAGLVENFWAAGYATGLDVAETVRQITSAIPDVYAQ